MDTKPPAAKSSTALKASTGRDYAEWFAALDAWGARGRPYQEIAAWLTGDQEVSAWWAQKLIVEYEQDRGIRQPGARPGRGSAFTLPPTGNKTQVTVEHERLPNAAAAEQAKAAWQERLTPSKTCSNRATPDSPPERDGMLNAQALNDTAQQC